MKTRKLISLAVLIMVLFISCVSTGQEVKVDGVTYIADIAVEYKDVTEGAAQRYQSSNRFDNSKKDNIKAIKDYSRASYSERQNMISVLTADVNDCMDTLLAEKGFDLVRSYDQARFTIEGKVDVRYGKNEYGTTWFYDVFITAWDKKHAPLDYNRTDLVKMDRAVKPAARIETTDLFPQMSWSTHGEIYASDAEEAEKILMERLDREFRNSFVDDFFIL